MSDAPSVCLLARPVPALGPATTLWHPPTPPSLPPLPHPAPADRIAATLQLLTFFFISVFAFDPKKFCEDAIGTVTNGVGNGPAPYACPIAEGDDPEADYPNFFQLPVLMLMLITLLNDGTLISVGYDRVKPSPRPGEASKQGGHALGERHAALHG